MIVPKTSKEHELFLLDHLLFFLLCLCITSSSYYIPPGARAESSCCGFWNILPSGRWVSESGWPNVTATSTGKGCSSFWVIWNGSGSVGNGCGSHCGSFFGDRRSHNRRSAPLHGADCRSHSHHTVPLCCGEADHCICQ